MNLKMQSITKISNNFQIIQNYTYAMHVTKMFASMNLWNKTHHGRPQNKLLLIFWCVNFIVLAQPIYLNFRKPFMASIFWFSYIRRDFHRR